MQRLIVGSPRMRFDPSLGTYSATLARYVLYTLRALRAHDMADSISSR